MGFNRNLDGLGIVWYIIFQIFIVLQVIADLVVKDQSIPLRSKSQYQSIDEIWRGNPKKDEKEERDSNF